VPVGQVIKQLRGIGGSSQVFSGGGKVTSIPDAIAQVLNKHFGHATADSAGSAEICPQCSAAMRFDAGCFTCASCGYSTC
jgi:ribonucleoside-diphosphate reductase alpha chain